MTKRKRRPQARHQPAPTETTLRELKACLDVQEQLKDAQNTAQKLQARRRMRVRAAFAAGATTRELSRVLGISRTKIYQLIGSARAVQA
jgi:DNA-directed RNA polymerase specialized sigma subunit